MQQKTEKFQVLCELAIAMAGQRTLDENLALIVEKASGLLGTETAFVALRDDDAGDVFMHTVSGIETEAFKTLRIPFGQGLGGKVVVTGRSSIVEDYFKEVDDLLHDVVRREGLISGMAAPIQIGERNLGVLYAFNRAKTTFSTSDLDTLSLLGNLAAVEITRKRIEARYRSLYEDAKRSEELYRSLLNSSPDAIVIYDMEGRVRYVNDSFTQIFGWSMQEMLDKRIPFVPDPEKEVTAHQITRVVRDGLPCPQFETKRMTKRGRTLNVSISASRYNDHEGNPAGMLVILRDVTEQNRLEEQLRHTAKMEALGVFAAGLAHDFNNLLTAVMGYSGILKQQIPTHDPSYEKISQIGLAAERASWLARQLLAFGRKQILEVKLLDVNEVITNFQKILGRFIGEDIELVTVLDPSVGAVEADQSQMEQILVNLAVNARDAMPHGGRLTIETRNAVLNEKCIRAHSYATAGAYVVLVISDTGQGMDSATLDRIFEPFFTTKRKNKGTGLGLSTVYGILKQHRGHIAASSQPEKGTTFRVYLPRARGRIDRTSETLTQPALPQGSETVLVVEDEEIVRNLTCEVLGMLGYSVLVGCEPAEAIGVVNEHPGTIHLLLTDVVMPHMDGPGLFKVLTPLRPEMKVLYLSGYAEKAVFGEGKSAGGRNFLQKPFSIDRLAQKVREVLDEKGGAQQGSDL